jgi:alpha-ketoglutarate-dependent taurine dioxygenase
MNAQQFHQEHYARAMRTHGYFLAQFPSTPDLLSLINTIGVPRTHDPNGTLVWDIRPQTTDVRAARSHQASEFPWHTDCAFENPPPEYMALLVVQPDRFGGGESLLLDTQSFVFSAATQRSLQQPFPFRAPREFEKGEPITYGSILLPRGMRYRREIIPDELCTREQLHALDALDEVIARSNPMRTVLPQNSILFLDNHRFLHARTEIYDPQRHLQRIRYDAKP